MKITKLPVVALTLATLATTPLFTGCTSAETGAGIGAAAGGGIAALAGGSTAQVFGGAAVGAAAGALTGLAIDANRRDQYHRNAPRGGWPVAQPTNRYGFVRSPYTGRTIDVRGFRRGDLARDPSTRNGDIFIVP